MWDQSVVYHLDAPGTSSRLDNASKLISTFFTRDIVLVAAAAVTAGAALLRLRSAPDGNREPTATEDGLRPRISTMLWIWLTGLVVLLIGEHPLWRPHVSEITPAVALLIAYYRPPWKWAALAALLAIPLHLAYALDLLTPEGYPRDEAELVAELELLPEGAVAISDEPGQVWRAGLVTPPELVDASVLLVDSGRLTADDIARSASDPEVCAVVVWSSRFGGMAELPDLLTDEGFSVERTFSTDVEIPDGRLLNDRDSYDQVLYLRSDCLR